MKLELSNALPPNMVDLEIAGAYASLNKKDETLPPPACGQKITLAIYVMAF